MPDSENEHDKPILVKVPVNYIGQPNEFNPITDEWTIFVRRLSAFFEANDVPDNKKKSILLSLVNQEAYKLLIDLCTPERPEDKTYEELTVLLDKHYSPKLSVFKERYSFYEATRSPGESVQDWAARVQHLAASCQFGEHFSFAVVDKFVLGFENGKIKEQLFSEDPSKLTISGARETAQQTLTAHQLFDKSDVTGAKSESEVYKFSQGRKKCIPRHVVDTCQICGYD